MPNFIEDAWYFFRHNWQGIAQVIAPFIVPLNLVFVLLEFRGTEQSQQLQSLLMVSAFLLYPIYQGALIFYIHGKVSGSTTDISQCYRLSLSYWPKLIVLYLLSGIAIFAGLLMLIFPGFIVMARIICAEFFCLFKGSEPPQALTNSWELTKPHQGRILKGLLFILLATTVPFWLLEGFLVKLGAWNMFSAFAIGIVSTVIGSLSVIFAYRIYSYLTSQATSTDTP